MHNINTCKWEIIGFFYPFWPVVISASVELLAGVVDLDDGVAGLDDGVAGLDGGLVDLEDGDAGLDGVAGVTDVNGLSGDIFFCLCTRSKVDNPGVSLMILLDVTSLFSSFFKKFSL